MKKWVILLLPLTLLGKDFGTMGHTFPIEEESFLSFMQRKGFGQRMLDAKKILFEKAKQPLSVKMGVARQPRSFQLDLTFKVEKDIEDANGQVIAKRGTAVNPLEKTKLSSGLLFLDGSNETHLNWARKQKGNFKWILVSGKPIDLEEMERRPIYFDQGGFYTARFQIENVPAKVSQKGKLLLVEEVVL